jgi:hypothetical protein
LGGATTPSGHDFFFQKQHKMKIPKRCSGLKKILKWHLTTFGWATRPWQQVFTKNKLNFPAKLPCRPLSGSGRPRTEPSVPFLKFSLRSPPFVLGICRPSKYVINFVLKFFEVDFFAMLEFLSPLTKLVKLLEIPQTSNL